jgi:2-aminoethylphosphonate dioxygenase
MLTTGRSALTAAQLEQYREQGFLVLSGVFTRDEIAELAEEAEQLISRQELIQSANIRCRWQNHIETGDCLFECFDPVADIGPVCSRVAHDPRIMDALGMIYGDEACLFKDKLIFKPPGAKGYSLHQDYIGWRDFPQTFVTVQVTIDPADADNGATEVFPGYHQAGYLSPLDGEYHDVPLELIDESRGVKLALEPGDLAIFGCFTPHRSAPNRSDRWRRQLYLSYNARSDGGQRREAHYQEFHTWLRKKYADYGKSEVYFE